MKGQGSIGQRRVVETAGFLPRILVLELCKDRLFTTNGLNTFTYCVLTDADFEQLGIRDS